MQLASENNDAQLADFIESQFLVDQVKQLSFDSFLWQKIHEMGVIRVVIGLGLSLVAIWCCSGRNYLERESFSLNPTVPTTATPYNNRRWSIFAALHQKKLTYLNMKQLYTFLAKNYAHSNCVNVMSLFLLLWKRGWNRFFFFFFVQINFFCALGGRH